MLIAKNKYHQLQEQLAVEHNIFE